jgi:hypothetical protein
MKKYYLLGDQRGIILTSNQLSVIVETKKFCPNMQGGESLRGVSRWARSPQARSIS